MAKIVVWLSKKTVRLMFKIIEITLALLIVLSGIVFWRLSVSPMNVDFLVPELVERFVPKDANVTVDVNSIVLFAEMRDEGLLHLKIEDLSVLRQDGTVITDLPEIEMSYGLWRILTLNYMPDTLSVQNALLQAILDENGNFYLQSKGEKTAAPENVPATEPVKVSDFNKVFKYIMEFNQLELENAQVLIENKRQQKQFSIPRLDLLMEKESTTEHALSIAAEMSVQDSKMNVTAHALFNHETRQMPFEIDFDSLNVSKLSRMIKDAAGINLNVKGVVMGNLDLTHSDKNVRNIVSELSFKLMNERAGTVNLPAPLTNDYHVDSMLIQGAFAPHLETLKIDNSKLTTGKTTATLTVDMAGIGTFLDTKELDHVKIVLKSLVKNVKTEQVPNLWPSALGPDAHAWVKANLSEGGISTADFTLYFTGTELVDLFGDIKASGVKVRYLDPMPAVQDVAATVHLYPDKVDIFATTGTLNDLNLTRADLHFTDLKDKVSHANILLKGNGPVQDVMRLIDSKPLEFARAFGIDPEKTGGTGTVQVDLKFPLIESLNINQVTVQVDADIKKGKFPTPIAGESVTDGDFKLAVNNQGLKLSGTALMRTVPLDLTWTEYFKKSKGPQSVYDIKGTVSDSMLKPWVQDIESYLSGKAGITAKIQKSFAGETTVNVTADLTNSMIRLYPIGVEKESKVPAELTAETKFKKTPELVSFHLNSPKTPVNIAGSVSWSDGFAVRLDKVSAVQNQFSGRVAVDAKGNSTIILKGSSWNMSQLFDMPLFKKTPADTTNSQGEEKEQIANVQIAPPNVTLDVNLNTVILEPKKPLKAVEISGERRGYWWRHLNVSMGGTSPLEIHYIPQTRQLKGECSDLGHLLAALGATDRFFGGVLRLDAKQNNAGVFVGNIRVRDFNLKDPGFIIQAVTILGIVDGIRGKELNFKTAKIPFELTPYQNVYIENGYAYGTTLGLTFKGRASLSKLALSGQVIPAYLINSLPGRIPIIGNLFKDGAGGGLMGVRYELKGTPFNPSVSFNPLTSIAPGVLGNFFQ